MTKFEKIDLKRVTTYSIAERQSKVQSGQLAAAHRAGASFQDFLAALPSVLKASDLLNLAQDIVEARRQDLPVVLMMGAHVIKVGLSPVLIQAMRDGYITSLAMNGAGSIHDTELAYHGATSEDVAEGLSDGSFGMARETGEILNETVRRGMGSGKGFGELLGERLHADQPPYRHNSLLANAWEHNIPATVHVAVGTDIVHQQPSADGAAIGEATLNDFKTLAHQLSRLRPGAAVLLFGSTVILPEVFLKALTVVRNLGHPAHGFCTANFDMIPHYRPRVNVLQRPTQTGGHYFEFIGHHELLLPLLFAAVQEFAHGFHADRPAGATAGKKIS